MHIAYIDETGDDGYPRFSSPLFALSVLYVHYLNWQECYEAIKSFRRDLKASLQVPLKWEFHTRAFLLNKRPYRGLGLGMTTGLRQSTATVTLSAASR